MLSLKIEEQKRELELYKSRSSPAMSLAHRPHPPRSTNPVSKPTIKKRKVAPAPPPKSYSGFTTESEKVASVRPKLLAGDTSKKPHPLATATDRGTGAKWAVPPPQCSTITPSSWRSEQALANRYLRKESQAKHSTAHVNGHSGDTRWGHEPSAAVPTDNTNALGLLRDLEDHNSTSDDDDESVHSNGHDTGIQRRLNGHDAEKSKCTASLKLFEQEQPGMYGVCDIHVHIWYTIMRSLPLSKHHLGMYMYMYMYVRYMYSSMVLLFYCMYVHVLHIMYTVHVQYAQMK